MAKVGYAYNQNDVILCVNRGGIYATFRAQEHQDMSMKMAVSGVAQVRNGAACGDVLQTQGKVPEQAPLCLDAVMLTSMATNGI